MKPLTLSSLMGLPLLLLVGCTTTDTTVGPVELRPSLEHRMADGSVFTASTQSILRHHHWLEGAETVTLRLQSDALASVELKQAGDPSFTFKNVPILHLVPRLYYPHADKLDAFDAFNLMLAEYSRNGINMPTGRPGDQIAHFETALDGEAPYTTANEYDFKPNPSYRPIRAQVVNNCLRPGLWEVGANDTAGEIYHGWFDFPLPTYYRLVAHANGLASADGLDLALAFKENEVPLDLNRLRTVTTEIGAAGMQVSADDRYSYSSQDSRRKMQRGMVQIAKADGTWGPPTRISDITSGKVRLTSFIEPGIYSAKDHEIFDLTFLRGAQGATFYRTRPLTTYTPGVKPAPADASALEIHLDLGDKAILLGNLPMKLLVPQQEFSIDGYGVGVMSPSDLSEQRQFRIDTASPPAFAYVAVQRDGVWHGVNSHKWGLEQIFIRPRFDGGKAVLEITLTSYERIVDIIRYEVEIPSELLPEFAAARDAYVPPLYYSHRDDNIR